MAMRLVWRDLRPSGKAQDGIRDSSYPLNSKVMYFDLGGMAHGVMGEAAYLRSRSLARGSLYIIKVRNGILLLTACSPIDCG